MCDTFGDGGIERVGGHPEVELGLAELARLTGEQRYLDQAATFVERRGRGTLGEIQFGPAYFQDDIPIRDATVFRGHAVRALYLAAGAVDVAVETGDDELLGILIAQWENTIARRTYLTGGMGSQHTGEAFGDDFVLPPDRAYSETCAGIASVMLAWRLLLATGEARFADLIERTLHNVVATSPAPDGRHFFYANPLHQRVPGTVPARRRGEQAGVDEPARAVVPRLLLPDQRRPHARQPRRLRRHRRRRRDPDSTSTPEPDPHDARRRPHGRARASRPTIPTTAPSRVKVTETDGAAVGAHAADPPVGGWGRAGRRRTAGGRSRRAPSSSSDRSPSVTRSRSPCRWRPAGPAPTRGSTPCAAASPSSAAPWCCVPSRSTCRANATSTCCASIPRSRHATATAVVVVAAELIEPPERAWPYGDERRRPSSARPRRKCR